MNKKSRFRTHRLFHIAGEGWYLECREGNQGPFPTREKADSCLETLMNDPHAGQPEWQPSPDDSGAWLAHDRSDGERRNDRDRRNTIRFETALGTRRSGQGRRRIDAQVRQIL